MVDVYLFIGCHNTSLLGRFCETAMEEKEARAIRVKTDTDEFVLYGRPCELSAFSHIAPNRHVMKDRTYFNVEKKVRHNSVPRCL